ncbi:phage protein NinX family protein [Huaxiibacter chinensis]|uniref:phage protein NinX family protein n=1 Tax=Huaxiibacter chinensis TaxID=2899785 RepID=UPI003F9C7773
MDYSKMSDFEVNKAVAIALDIDMHFFIPESEESFLSGFLPSELGPIWQTSANFLGEFNVSNGNVFNPCNNPADAWPIITGNYISLMYEESLGKWCAGKPYWVDGCEWQFDMDVIDENPLRAAMIVFMMMQESANVQDNPA